MLKIYLRSDIIHLLMSMHLQCQHINISYVMFVPFLSLYICGTFSEFYFQLYQRIKRAMKNMLDQIKMFDRRKKYSFKNIQLIFRVRCLNQLYWQVSCYKSRASYNDIYVIIKQDVACEHLLPLNIPHFFFKYGKNKELFEVPCS